MTITEDRTEFLVSNPQRVWIAEWCADKPLSRPDIARKLNRKPGGLSAPDTMLKEGALQDAGTKSTGKQGVAAQLLRFNPAWRRALLAAQLRLKPAQLNAGTDLLLVPLADTYTACEILAVGNSEIDWGVELTGEQLGVLLAARRDETGGAAIRAAAALNAAGAHPVRLRLNAPMAAAELQEWARSVVTPSSKALPTG